MSEAWTRSSFRLDFLFGKPFSKRDTHAHQVDRPEKIQLFSTISAKEAIHFLSDLIETHEISLQIFSIQADRRRVTGKTAALGHYQDGHQIKWLWFYSVNQSNDYIILSAFTCCLIMAFYIIYIIRYILALAFWCVSILTLVGHLRPCSPFHPSHDTGVHDSWARKIAVACIEMANRAESFKGGNATVKPNSSSGCTCESVTSHGKWISMVEWKTVIQRWSWCKRFKHWPWITDRSADGCRCVYLHV